VVALRQAEVLDFVIWVGLMAVRFIERVKVVYFLRSVCFAYPITHLIGAMMMKILTICREQETRTLGK